MPRRELFTSTQRDELLAFPTDENDLLRCYTFNTHDLAVIRRRHGDHNRLGLPSSSATCVSPVGCSLSANRLMRRSWQWRRRS
jgi:Domain of unknown function (DUF4158)